MTEKEIKDFVVERGRTTWAIAAMCLRLLIALARNHGLFEDKERPEQWL